MVNGVYQLQGVPVLIVCRLMGLSAVVFALSVLVGGLLPDWLVQSLQRGGPLRPLGAVIILLLGLLLVLSDQQSQALRRIRIGLSWLTLILALTALIDSLVRLPYGLHALAAPWWIASTSENFRLAPFAAFSFAMTAIMALLIDTRESLIRDALIHSIMGFFTAIIIPNTLAFLPGPSVVSFVARFEGIAFQSLFVPALLAVGFWCHWLLMRARTDSTRPFTLPYLGVAGGTVFIMLMVIAWSAAIQASVTRSEMLQRDHLERVFKLQARAFGAALESADEATDVLAGLRLLNEKLQFINRGEGRDAHLRDVELIARNFVKKDITAVTILALNGSPIVEAGLPLTQAAFDHALGHDHRLLWNDRAGPVLRRRIAMVLDGVPIGTTVVDVRLRALDKIFADAATLGASAETIVCVSRNIKSIDCLPTRLQDQVFTLERVEAGGRGRALTLAVDGNLGTAITLDHRGREVFAVFGGVAPYPIGMVTQVIMAEGHGPLRGHIFAMYLLALLQLILVSILLRRPVPR